MKTTLKKALSVLMAVLVFVGGLFVAFNIDNISADENAYDAVYDYTASSLKSVAINGNLSALGIHSMSPTPTATDDKKISLYINENSSPNGISPTYNQMMKQEWGYFEQAYIIYQVKPGTKFEANLYINMNQSHAWCREWVANKTKAPFELKIEASANGVDGWKNAWDTSGETTTKDITKVYDVPADCHYVKITFPQKGKVVDGSTVVATNDLARVHGVKYVKAEPIKYDTTYDYTDTDTFGHASISGGNMANYGMVGVGPGLYAWEDSVQNRWKGINPSQTAIAAKTWGNFETYVIYEVKPGTYFEADFYLASNSGNSWCKQNIAAAAGAPFEFVIEASPSATGGWKNAKDTSSITEKNITMTYKVPADCSYVKITFPQKGQVANVQPNNATVQGNDLGRLLGVKYFKAPEKTFNAEYNYTDLTKYPNTQGVSANSAATYGIHSVLSGGTAGSLCITEKTNDTVGYGINPTYGSLLNKTWDSLEKPYVIYEVNPGTYFDAKLFVGTNTGNGWCKEAITAATGETFEFTIEASSSATDGWKNAVGTYSATGSEFNVSYFVPEDCNFVKITFPQKGTVAKSANNNNVTPNTTARLLGVKFTKAPVKTYNTEYDYAYVAGNANDVHLSAANKAQYGIYDCSVNVAGQYAGIVLNSKSGTKVRDGLEIRYDTVMSKAYGTLNKPYIIYEVQPGTYFEGTFLFNVGTGNSWCKEAIEAKTGKGFDFTIEASANSTSGWKNAVSTSGATATQVIAYAVPEDCSYVKISFPQTGYIENVMPNNATVAGNDIARVGKVRYTKAPEKTYTTEYNYAHDATGASYESVNTNASKYGIYATSGSNAAGLVKNTGRDGIEIDYGKLDANAWGTLANPYVVYEVTPGTWFEASLYLASTTAAKPSAYTKQAISGKTGEPFEFEISASVDGNSWKNVKNTASITDTNIKFEYLIPEDCNFVKVSFPQKGKISGVPHNGNASDLKTIQANDLARLLNVRYTAPVPAFNTTYDYTTDLVAQYATISGANAAKLGLTGFSNGLIYDEQMKNVGIGASMTAINAKAWGETEFYLIYEVTPGTKFFADFQLSTAAVKTGWGKETFAHLAGEPWEFTISASDSDTSGWKSVVTSAGQTEKFFTIEYDVPADCTFVKITFPQKGRVEPFCDECNGYHLRDASTANLGLQGNDLAKVRKVSFTAPANQFDGCDTIMDYKANGPVNFFYDNDAFLISLYQKNGIAVEAISNGSTLVAPDKNYVAGTGYSKPYVTYAVMPSTNFVAAINVNRTAAAALGADFKVKLYESADGATWTENTVAPIAAGATDYFKFETAATTKFVKIEFPHTDANNQTDKYNEIFGIAKVGLTRDESAYEIENPYGNYKFEKTYKFHGDPRPASFNADESGIYEVLNTGLGFESDPAKPGYYLAYTYGNLVGKTDVSKAGFVYSVKPGTAFQVIALVSRDDGFIQMIEKKLGTNWDIMLEVSSDGKNWTSYNPSRVLTEEHLLDSTPLRYKTEVITIPVLPSDAKFVKVIYPQTGDMNKVTEDAFPYTGNDLIGVAQVSLTWGGAVPASQYKPDKSNFNTIMDAAEGATDESNIYVTGLQYASGMQVMAPSWTYLNGTGGAVMAQTGIYAAVKEGSAFYAEAAFKGTLHVGELDENGVIVKNQDGNPIVKKTVDPFTYIDGYGARLYFSSDRMTWTEVTDKYLQVIKGSGSLPVLHRFDIAKLPAGVKYVKVELPINRNMIGCPVGNEGLATCYTGNDFCGIRRFYFNADEHVEYKSEINYGNYFTEDYGSGFPTSLTGENNKVLGIYSYTPGAFEIKDYTSSSEPDGRITIKESYLFNKKEVDAPYLVYNVEPNSPFYMGVNVSAVGRLSAMPDGRLRLYVSETGQDGSWTEFTDYTYTENQGHTYARYFADNLGAKTKFLMIVYPITGDLSLDSSNNAKGNSGANFFQIRDIYTNIVDFDPTWDNKKDYVFIHPNGEQQVIIPGAVTVNPFNWLFVIIPAAAVLVLAAAAVVIILIIKKKKNATPKA